jgi:hypothetical protein
VRVGEALLERVQATGACSVVVVGTGKNVGKTVVARAIVDAAYDRGLRVGVASVGRDGEEFDVIDGRAKPRMFLRSGTVVATARDVLPRSPASEILEVSDVVTAVGVLLFGRVRAPQNFEIVGAPTAAGVRTTIEKFREFGCEFVVVDGAIDRLAALAGGDDAVVAVSAAGEGKTHEEAIDDLRSLTSRLRVPKFDPRKPSLRIEGAFGEQRAAELMKAREARQIVVRDPTQITLSGKSWLQTSERLLVRCERPLNVVAVCVASLGDPDADPLSLVRDAARTTGLPAFDVYAGLAA